MSDLNDFIREGEKKLFTNEKYEKVLGEKLMRKIVDSVIENGGTIEDLLRILSLYIAINIKNIYKIYGCSTGNQIIENLTVLSLNLLRRMKKNEDSQQFIYLYENVKEVFELFIPSYTKRKSRYCDLYTTYNGLAYTVLRKFKTPITKRIMINSIFENIKITKKGISREDLRKIRHGLEILNYDTSLIFLIENIYRYSRKKIGTSYAQNIFSLILRKILTSECNNSEKFYACLNYAYERLFYMKYSDRRKYTKFEMLIQKISNCFS